MLSVNGEAKTTDPDSIDPAVIQARDTLDRLDRKLQARKWFFNTEVMTLSPNTAGEVVVPQNALSVDPVDRSSPYLKRGDTLYDPENNTRVIDKDVKCIVVLQLDIDETPESFSSWLLDKATMDYYINEDGDTAKARLLAEREAESYAWFKREDINNKDLNIRSTPLGSQLLRNTQNRVRIKGGDDG